MNGESIDTPQVANLVDPKGTKTINGMKVDMHKFAEAAERLGADKLDVLSIGGYRNSKGEFVPDYTSVRIEQKASA